MDGTKMVANASVNRSYDAEGLSGLLDRLERTIADLEAQNEAGEDVSAVHLPEQLASKEALRQQVRQAMDYLTSQKRHKRINLTVEASRWWCQRHGNGSSKTRITRTNSPMTSTATALRGRQGQTLKPGYESQP